MFPFCDGMPDVAVANENSNNVSVLLGNGNGTFQSARNFLPSSSPFSIVVGDFDLDNRPDLAGTQGAFGVAVLMGNGDGTFRYN